MGEIREVISVKRMYITLLWSVHVWHLQLLWTFRMQVSLLCFIPVGWCCYCSSENYSVAQEYHKAIKDTTVCSTTLHWLFWQTFISIIVWCCVVLNNSHFASSSNCPSPRELWTKWQQIWYCSVPDSESIKKYVSDWWTLNSNKSFNCKTKIAGFSNTMTSQLSSK
jgi:hypothetical protein